MARPTPCWNSWRNAGILHSQRTRNRMAASPPASGSLTAPTAEAVRQLEMATNDQIPAVVQQARAAWRNDLPKLMATHYGQWVAYHGERQISICHTKTELVQQCLRAGLK